MKGKGKICLLTSAFIYGLTPILAKITYDGGANGITLTFLRAVLSVPLLYIILKADGKTLYLTGTELRRVVILSIFGGALPIVLLYMAYSYIPTGLATTLHFIYPLVTVIASAFIYREKIGRMKLIAAVCVTVGIFLFVDISTSADQLGIILALLSGIFYSFYVIYIDRSGLDDMDYVKLTFYLMLTMSAAILIFGLAVDGINFDITPQAWAYSAVISLLVTLGATPLFQVGVREEGASTAGVMSTFEPITSVALGAMFLGEAVGTAQLVGCAMILAGVAAAQK